MKLQKDLREFIELLNSHDVHFIVVGSYALAFHGHPRFTGDIDFFVENSLENAEKLEKVIEAFGFSALEISHKDFLEPNNVIQLGVSPNRIDLLTTLTAVSFEEAWTSRVSGKLDELEVFFISRDLLIKNKRTLGRAQDLADVEALK